MKVSVPVRVGQKKVLPSRGIRLFNTLSGTVKTPACLYPGVYTENGNTKSRSLVSFVKAKYTKVLNGKNGNKVEAGTLGTAKKIKVSITGADHLRILLLF